MAIVCPACGTENRSIAKFCIECIAPLPTGFARTQQMKPDPEPAPDDEMPSALAAFASAGPPSPMMPADWAVPRPVRRGRWRAMAAALLVLLVVGAVGLLAVGDDLSPEKDLKVAPAPAPSPPDPHPRAGGAVQAAAVVPAVSVQPGTAPTLAEALAPGESVVTGGAPASRPVPSRPAPPSVGAPVAPALAAAMPAAVPPASTLPTVTGKLERTPSLFARCDDMSFIASSRCKVDVCAQAANLARKECEPVLAQQRLMEEKRNPTLAN